MDQYVCSLEKRPPENPKKIVSVETNITTNMWRALIHHRPRMFCIRTFNISSQKRERGQIGYTSSTKFNGRRSQLLPGPEWSGLDP
jgi:hypothetical protein